MVFGTIFGPFLRVHFHVSGRKYTPDLGSREGSKMAILGVPDPLEEGPETLVPLGSPGLGTLYKGIPWEPTPIPRACAVRGTHSKGDLWG